MNTRFVNFVILSIVITVVSARPAVDSEPIKFSLDTSSKEDVDTQDKSLTAQVNSRIQDGMDWLGRMADAIRFGRGRLVNSVAIARNIIAERLEEIMSETRNNVAGAIGAANDIIVKSRSTLQSYERAPFAQFLPPKTREDARLETEEGQAILEKKKVSPITTLLENVLKPKPIVDNITEGDKYGNNGDRFIGVGRALVSGFEGLTNLFNAIVEIPVNAAKKTSRNITEALNQIGSRIIGLQ